MTADDTPSPVEHPGARRFGGINRLYPTPAGDGSPAERADALTRLSAAHVAVVGLGGVGSWAAEGLARSGVGHITLVDMDHVAESNINRQLHANDDTLGMSKVDAMAAHIARYAPGCNLSALDDFAHADNLDALLTPHGSDAPPVLAVIDACDQAPAKVALAVWSQRHGVKHIMAGAAGGKTKPWLLQVSDLSVTVNDPLLAKVRYQLRRQHAFPGGGPKVRKVRTPKMGLMAVHSDEPLTQPESCDASAGLNCAGFGSIVTVTGAMGFVMASWVIDELLR